VRACLPLLTAIPPLPRLTLSPYVCPPSSITQPLQAAAANPAWDPGGYPPQSRAAQTAPALMSRCSQHCSWVAPRSTKHIYSTVSRLLFASRVPNPTDKPRFNVC